MTHSPTCHPDLITFWRLLAEGFCTGRPLLTVLQSIQTAVAPEPMGNIVADLIRDIDDGKSLSDALRRHPTIFTRAHICLVQAGEDLGRLDRILLLILEFTWNCPTCANLRFPVPESR